MWQASCQRGQCDQIYPLTLTTVKGITHIVLMRTRLAVLCALHGTLGRGGRGERHGTLWGPHGFVCNVCTWRSVGAKWEMWSYMKQLEDAGDTKRRRSESSRLWSLAEGSASLSCEGRGWSGSFSRELEFFFKEVLVLLNKTKLPFQDCGTCPVIFLPPLFWGFFL